MAHTMSLLLAALGAASLVASLPASPFDMPVLSLENIKRSDVYGDIVDKLGKRYSGPLLASCPDPALIKDGSRWVAYCTASNGKSIPVLTATSTAGPWNLTGLEALSDKGPWHDPNDKSPWAPDVIKNDAGTFVMYYASKQLNNGPHCIGAATSTSATGPFSPVSKPLVCNDAGGGVIDASGYDDGTDRWLLWKVDGNSKGGATSCTGGPKSDTYITTPIMIQRMSRDGLTLLDSPHQILDNQGASNDGVVEAPSLYKVASNLFILFYSAHCYSSDDYDIEYAWSNTITGSYTGRGILIRSVDNKGVWGPGGLDIDVNGKDVVFHGRSVAKTGNAARGLYSAQLSIKGLVGGTVTGV